MLDTLVFLSNLFLSPAIFSCSVSFCLGWIGLSWTGMLLYCMFKEGWPVSTGQAGGEESWSLCVICKLLRQLIHVHLYFDALR